MELNTIIQGSALSVLRSMPDESIDCCITSPPYWGLRDYGVEGQLGMETSFYEFIEKLCTIFDEVKRILKKEGTCWINLGDTYSSKPVGNFNGGGNIFSGRNMSGIKSSGGIDKTKTGIKEKSLCQIPSRFAIAMSDRGWILRNKIIWHKPNCMPNSVRDRFTVDFEEIFFFVKSKKYYFKKQLEPVKEISLKRSKGSWKSKRPSIEKTNPGGIDIAEMGTRFVNPLGRNKRAVWTITTHSFKDAHFATFPEKLVIPMILAGCPENGVVLDPFMGAGTTGLVARKYNRNYIGIELNPEYIEMANKRINALLF